MNPCGRIVDYQRSCATALIRPFLDDPGRTVKIRWYRVPWDTPALGVPTVFSSSIWDTESILDPPIGEVRLSRKENFYRGYPPLFIPVGKPGRCGTPEQWANGVLTTDPPPPINSLTGEAGCCGPGVAIFGGGLAFGGKWKFVEGSERGGVAFGGTVGLHATIRDTGGVAFGGLQYVAINWPSQKGGVAFGGAYALEDSLHPQGGVAFGGVADLKPKTIDTGGVAFGGVADLKPKTIDTGGVAFGGVAAIKTNEPDQAGGVAFGGVFLEKPAFTGAGGVAFGGTMASPPATTKVSTSCCTGTTPATVHAAFSGYGSPLTDINGYGLDLTYNASTGKWEGNWSMHSHTGAMTFSCNSGFNWATQGTGGGTWGGSAMPGGSCGSPITFNFVLVNIGTDGASGTVTITY